MKYRFRTIHGIASHLLKHHLPLWKMVVKLDKKYKDKWVCRLCHKVEDITKK